MNRAFPLTLAFAAALVLAAAHADAQGNGNGNGNGRPKAPWSNPAPTAPSPSSPTTSAPASGSSSTSTSSNTPTSMTDAGATNSTASVVTFRQFGAWLDDASAAVPGDGYVSIGVGYWRMPGMSQTNVPMLGGGLGVTDQLQVSATVPFYNVQYEGGSARGLDDMYLGAKYTLIDPTLTISEFGLAVSPVVEVLSAGAPGGRVHFAIPVSMELRRSPFRMYGSAGYFTRGSVFTAGALEWASPSRLVVTGMLTQSYSVKADPMLDSLAVGRRHVDAMASAAYPLGTLAVGYASIGRSLSSLEEGGASLALTGGVSLRLQR